MCIPQHFLRAQVLVHPCLCCRETGTALGKHKQLYIHAKLCVLHEEILLQPAIRKSKDRETSEVSS